MFGWRWSTYADSDEELIEVDVTITVSVEELEEGLSNKEKETWRLDIYIPGIERLQNNQRRSLSGSLVSVSEWREQT